MKGSILSKSIDPDKCDPVTNVDQDLLDVSIKIWQGTATLYYYTLSIQPFQPQESMKLVNDRLVVTRFATFYLEIGNCFSKIIVDPQTMP